MKKLFLLIPFILISCSQEKTTHLKSPTSSDIDTTVDMIKKTEIMLKKTEGLEEKVEKTYHTKDVLVK